MDTLPIGVILIVGHNVWVWDWPLALTVAGWAMTIKCTLYLLVPHTADRVLDRNVAKTSRGYQAGDRRANRTHFGREIGA